jgi:transcriptional regulator with XRE-family HTH domain
MTTKQGRAFNEWLRAQLKAKKMSQRQLAQQSGVDHSTISRLIRGDRMPSLGTATKLARGLREIHEDTDTQAAIGVVSFAPQNPTARVEYALRADESLTEAEVRQVMEYYLAIRLRRFSRAYQPAESVAAVGGAKPTPGGARCPAGARPRPLLGRDRRSLWGAPADRGSHPPGRPGTPRSPAAQGAR